MSNWQKLCFGIVFLVLASVPGWGQTTTPPSPIPIPGGDIVPPLFNQFFPGIGAGFDGLNADPHGITNFRGVVAMGYTNGLATDNANKIYQVITDVRVYQGDYIGAQATYDAGGTTSAKAHGTFVEIWIDFWLPSSGTPTQQVHDFNPRITPNGIFWIVEIPDDAVKISPDGESLTIHLENVPVVDQGSFPAGTGTTPATVSFDITYAKSGAPRHVHPTSHDPLSPFNWAGEMWTATNSGTFSVKYNDNSFSAQGTFSSDFLPAGNFGEMGTESNGSFVERENAENETEANGKEIQRANAQISAGATANDPVSAAETMATALRSSRAGALRASQSKP